VNSDDIEGLIIPGGWLENLEDELISLILKFDEEKKLIAAICAAPWILAKAGILEKRKYTTSIAVWEKKHKDFFGIDDPFPRQGYLEKRVVRDDNIITGKGTAFIDFTIEVCDYLGVFKDEFEKDEFEKDIKGI
jgi:putative intracellular protease/amidase